MARHVLVRSDSRQNRARYMTQCDHLDQLPEDWTDSQGKLFVKLYKFMLQNQGTFMHPQAPTLAQECWNTVCHNAAWAAANFSNDEEMTILDTETNEVLIESAKGLDS